MAVTVVKNLNICLEQVQYPASDMKAKEKDVIIVDDKSFGAGFFEGGPGNFDWEYWYNEVVYIIEGGMVIKTEGKEYEVEKGDVVHILPRTKLSIIIKDRMKCFYVTHPYWKADNKFWVEELK